MKKISLRGISEILSEKELKNVLGGSGSSGGNVYDWSCYCGAGGGDVHFHIYNATADEMTNKVIEICGGYGYLGGSCFQC